MLAVTVLGLLYRRSKQQKQLKEKEASTSGSVLRKRPEPEGREEPRQEARGGRKGPGEPQPWRRPGQAGVAQEKGKFQLSQPLEKVGGGTKIEEKKAGWFGSKTSDTVKKVESKVEETPKKPGWFGSKSSDNVKKIEAKVEEAPKKSGWFGSKSSDEVKKVEEQSKKAGWFGSKPNNESKKVESKVEEAPKKSGWFASKPIDENKKSQAKVDNKSTLLKKSTEPSFKSRVHVDEEEEQRKFAAELAEVERAAVADVKSFMKPVRLNVEKNPRSRQESKQKAEREVTLLKRMCAEARDVVKLDEKEAAKREEKKEELAKVRSAR